MTHPAILVANCQILNKISTYTKCEREFMNHTMNFLSLSDSASSCDLDRHVRLQEGQYSQTSVGFAGFGKDVVRCGKNAKKS